MPIYTLESYRSQELVNQIYVTLVARNNKTDLREELTFKYYDWCFIEKKKAEMICRKYSLKKVTGYEFYMDDVPCSKVYFKSTSQMKAVLNTENVRRANLIYLRPDRKFLLDKKITYKFIVNSKQKPLDHNQVFPLETDDVDKVKTIYCDIEVDSEGDIIFPTGDNAIHPVITISYVCPNWDIIWTCLDENLKSNIEREDIDLKVFLKQKSIPEESRKVLERILEDIDEKNHIVKAIYFKEETEMLKYVGAIQEEYDAYVITGWNFTRFDAYYLIGRCKVLGIPKEVISIDGYLRHSKTHDHLGRDIVKVWSSTCYYIDCLDSFIKYYPENLRYNDLNSASLEVLGPEFKKFDMNMSIRDAYKIDKLRLMVYNVIDSILVRLIDEKIRLLQFFELRRGEKGLKISDVFATIRPTEAALLYFAEKEKIALPDSKKGERKETLIGADVYTEAPNIFPIGIMLDFRSEYPSIAASLNCSRKTLIRDQDLKDELNEAYEIYEKSGYKNKPKILMNYTVAPGQDKKIWFDNSYDCFEKKYLMDRFVLREKYFKLANQYEFDSLEYMIYHAYEQDKKLDGNGFYGSLANMYFMLGEIECSQAITSVGRALMAHQRKFIFSLGHKVAISDTDSVDLTIEDPNMSLDEAVKQGYKVQKEMAKEMDDFVQKAFLFGSKNGITEGFDMSEDNTDTHWIFAKFEQLFNPIITTGKKKFYAYKLVWKDGRFLKEPKYKVKGLPCIKRDSPLVFKDAQFGFIKHLLDEQMAFKPKAIKYLKSFQSKIIENDFDYLSGSAVYKNEIWNYKQVKKGYLPPIGAQAMCNSMANFGITFQPLNRFKVLRVTRIKSGKYSKKEIVLNGVKIKFSQKVVGYNDVEDLPDDFLKYFRPDYKHLYFDVIIKKNEVFLKMLGINPIIFTGQKQITSY